MYNLKHNIMKTKNIYQTTATLLAMFVFILFAMNGCSKDDPDPDPDPDTSVNDYLISLPSWSAFSPRLADQDDQFDSTEEFNCDDQLIITTTPASITRTPEDIVTYDPGSEILYLGSLIQGDGYIGGLGTIKSLPIYQRAPLSLSISFSSGDNNRTVENPSLTTVNQAVGELIESAHNAGHVSGSSIFYKEHSSYSLEQTALALGLSYKFMKGSVKTDLEWTNTTESHTVSAYFKQKMFTVSMGIPQRPSDLFSADFTRALLNEQISLGRIGPENLPVYVSNIVYGRMMMLTMTSEYTETEMKAALDASYNNIDGTVAAEHTDILQTSDIELVTIGGDANAALGFLREGNLGDFFENDAPLTTAVPISYTLRNLGDNNIAKVSETTNYDIVQYEEVGNEDIETYTNEGDWRSAVQNKMGLAKWECTRENIMLADEHNDFYYDTSSDQLFLYNPVTFSTANTGFPVGFYIENKDPLAQGYMGALVNHDVEPNGSFSIETISIGDIDNFENDDFEIGLTGNNVYAIAIVLVDNEHDGGEFLEVHAIDVDGVTNCQLGYKTDIINGFYGIISPVPIKKIFFNEGTAGGDDIALGDLSFGYKIE